MRCVKIQGGLGNQLFGLAMAWSVARLTAEPVSLDVASFRADPYGRRFLLGDLAARTGLTLTERPRRSHRLAGRLLRLAPGAGVATDRRPPRDRADLARLAVRGRYFDGYWNDARFFADPEDIRDRTRAFLLSTGPAAPAHDLVVHFRSYAEETRRNHRSTPDRAYFEAALDRVRRRQGGTADVVVVSDDPQAAAAATGLPPRPAAPDAGDPWSDLRLMLAARALILTNSTFSWWGGFCGGARTVVYPAFRRQFHYPRPAAGFDLV